VPLANVPQRISDLAAVQRGAVIIAHFTIPTFTTENNPIKTSVNLDFRAGVAGDPFNPGDWANEAKPISQFEVKDGLATFKIPTEAWTGKKVTIGVRSIGSNGKRRIGRTSRRSGRERRRRLRRNPPSTTPPRGSASPGQARAISFACCAASAMKKISP
jgi:hypothetical protein